MRRVIRYPYNSAIYNVREITKHMLLLEERLPGGKCNDCIRKHFLIMEALAEEAVINDDVSQYARLANEMARLTRRWQIAFADGISPQLIAFKIREKRKELVPIVFDPRG
jgi:hypothetical protein